MTNRAVQLWTIQLKNYSCLTMRLLLFLLRLQKVVNYLKLQGNNKTSPINIIFQVSLLTVLKINNKYI